jgi:protocatechuate 3,4-dioxygenase beta subunit
MRGTWKKAVLAVLPLLAACATGGSQPAAATPKAPAATAAPATSAAPSPDSAGAVSGAPACSGRPTPAQTEGPYFKPGSPERASLVDPGIAGTRLLVSGRVFSTDCRPLGGAVLDFWQADGSGRYDNTGYRLRGHQAADGEGRYALTTVVPGEYPGRTEHIHVKVAAVGKPVLTTQLYFPGVARNASDGIFDPALVMNVGEGAGGRGAAFDFVLRP